MLIYGQEGIDVWSNQPGPDSALMVRFVSLAWPSLVSPKVPRVPGRQCPQSIGRQKLSGYHLNHALPFQIREKVGDCSGYYLVWAYRCILWVKRVKETTIFAVPELLVALLHLLS